MHLAQLSVDTPSTIFSSSAHDTLVGTLLGRFILYAIPFAGMYFFIRLIFAGYSFMSSLGDPGKIQAAQSQLVNSGFGLLIVISSFFIIQMVQYIFRLNLL